MANEKKANVFFIKVSKNKSNIEKKSAENSVDFIEMDTLVGGLYIDSEGMYKRLLYTQYPLLKINEKYKHILNQDDTIEFPFESNGEILKMNSSNEDIQNYALWDYASRKNKTNSTLNIFIINMIQKLKSN